MPQMAPMNWTLLFMTFISIYLASMIIVYFTSKNSSLAMNLVSSEEKMNNLLWKW